MKRLLISVTLVAAVACSGSDRSGSGAVGGSDTAEFRDTLTTGGAGPSGTGTSGATGGTTGGTTAGTPAGTTGQGTDTLRRDTTGSRDTSTTRR